MADDIRALSAEYAADPTSLVFLRLGEALRLKGQFDAAVKVVVQGLGRYPHLPEAHDLYAKVLTDRRDFATAFDEWDMVLRLEPDHLGALKGIGFLYYRAGDREQALQHLRRAADLDPGDDGLRQAIERVASGQEVWDLAPGSPPALAVEGAGSPGTATGAQRAGAHTLVPEDPFASVEGAWGRILLTDREGLRLGGVLADADGRHVSEDAAAIAAGLAREIARATGMLDLGEWTQLTIEGETLSGTMTPAGGGATLLTVVRSDLPAGQLAMFTERAGKAARAWLERQR